MKLFEITKTGFHVTFATSDSAPDDVPHYEPTFIRGADKKEVRVAADAQIKPKHKQYVKIDTIRR